MGDSAAVLPLGSGISTPGGAACLGRANHIKPGNEKYFSVEMDSQPWEERMEKKKGKGSPVFRGPALFSAYTGGGIRNIKTLHFLNCFAQLGRAGLA